MVNVFSMLAAVCAVTLGTVSVSGTDGRHPNIIVIMMDDFGRADWSAGDGQWDTPNLDAFKEESIYLSHHYIGYVCSASRSQFLTGRYSFNSGYGTLDVFTNGKVGGIPLGTPTIADYLSHYSNYGTYAIGKWQLGLAFKEQTPTYRGFDYFYGFYGGLQDYYDKTAPLFASGAPPADAGYPDYISNDENEYLDFWENEKPLPEAAGVLSTPQYFHKMKEIITGHTNSRAGDPFFVYAAFQVAHGPYPEEMRGDDEEYLTLCQEEFGTGNPLCVVETNFDDLFGEFIDFMKSDAMKPVWEDTIILFTTDNGGDLESSCNYPLRGGKNTYFEGNQRVVTMVGGGLIPEHRRGLTLGGLFSNVDWVPTLLSFAGLIPTGYKQISLLNDENSDIPLTLDGYNMYEYLMESNVPPVRDHIVFQIIPKLNENNNEEYLVDYDLLQSKHISHLDQLGLEELGLIFFDDDGVLWKYYDTQESTNELGDVSTNTVWCEPNDLWGIVADEPKYTSSDKIADNVDDYDENDAFKALYDLTHDERESRNMLKHLDETDFGQLQEIIIEKTLQYFNEELAPSSMYLYGNFACFFDNLMQVAWPGYFNGIFAPFMDHEEFKVFLAGACGFNPDHIMYKLHSQFFNFEVIPDAMDEAILDQSHLCAQRNVRVFSVDDIVEREENDEEENEHSKEMKNENENKNKNENENEKEQAKEKEMYKNGSKSEIEPSTLNSTVLLLAVVAAIGLFILVAVLVCKIFKKDKFGGIRLNGARSAAGYGTV